MHFEFLVSVDVERIQGKFATRDEVQETIQTMLDEANYGSIDGIGPDGSSEYEITDWAVDYQEPAPKKGAK